MHCIVLRGLNYPGSWEGYRSVEILAYHHDEKKVEILFLLLLKNKVKNNNIMVLHPGNAFCEIVEPWNTSYGFIHHPDEPDMGSNGSSLLGEIYGSMFERHDRRRKLRQKNGLSSWDSQFPLEIKENVFVWPCQEKWFSGDFSRGFAMPVILKNEQEFSPYTTWCLGPFAKEGLFLVAFRIWFQGESYMKLVEQKSSFTVDGPSRLLCTIQDGYIPQFFEEKQQSFDMNLKWFANFLDFSGSYDVITLENHETGAVKVIPDMDASHMITTAPIQPNELFGAKRYITGHPRFKLTLQYAPHKVTSHAIYQKSTKYNK